MKPIRRMFLSSDEIHIADLNLVLELSSCGRGFITAETNTDYTGKVVRVDVGYTSGLLRWFTGYIERSQAAENGYQRLFVRELVGIFERHWPCSFQHPTLRGVAAWLTENSGITVTVPDVEYSDRPIPHFTHSGTGYQLLAAVGSAFSIPDFIWYQLPDGGLFLGSAAHSLFSNRPVEIPPEFSKGTAAGNSMILPVVQSMRPGVEMNGQRVTKIALNNDDMTVTWTPRNRDTGEALQKAPIQRQVEQHYPELASGMHLPKFARVISPSEPVTSGDFADPFRPRYAVAVQLLDADGNPEKNTPVYPAVPLPVPMAGNDSGMFQFPPEGTLVEIGFTGGRADKPFIRQTVPGGTSLPDVKPGEQLQQQREDVSMRVTQAGDWVRKTDQVISETSMARAITADTESRELVSRETTISATDTLTVIGPSKLMAGAIQHITTGDYAQAIGKNRMASVGGSDETEITGGQKITVGGDLIEQIGKIRKSVAAVKQEIIAPTVWIGSESINIAQLMIETLDVVIKLAEATANHTHQNTGAALNSDAISATGASARTLKNKYSPVIS